MKKRNGFTLIEIIVAVALLAIVGITVGISFNKIFKSNNDQNNNITVSKIKSSADVYLTGNTSLINELYQSKSHIFITIKDLQDMGLLADNIKDPTTGENIDVNNKIKASLDESGLIKYDYPAEDNQAEYLQALNVYMEKSELADCSTGSGTYNLVYVTKDGTYDFVNTNISSCDWNQTNSSTPGTYKVKYIYTTPEGISQSVYRNFIVQENVTVNIVNSGSSNWNISNFNLSANINRNAKIKYFWKKNGTTLNTSETNINVNQTGTDTYSVDYEVYNYNDSTKVAYTGSATISTKLELPSSIGDFTITGGTSNWVKIAPTFTVNTTTAPFSGVKKYQYCISNINTSCTNWTDMAGNQVTATVEGNKKLNIQIISEAGNTKVKTVNYYYDKTIPNCTSSGGSATWTKNNVSITGTCSDSISGCSGNVTKTYSTNINSTTQSPGTVYDNAGNSRVCPGNQTVRIDKTAPSCTSSGGSATWTKNNVTITGTCSDSMSGCQGNVTKTYSTNINSTTQSPGTVTDNAGNTTVCPGNRTVRIDKTAPSCTSSGGNAAWTKNNVTITGICYDTMSGCQANVTKTYSNTINSTIESPGSVYDNAGNSAICPGNQTVRIDKIAPVYQSGSYSGAFSSNYTESHSGLANKYYFTTGVQVPPPTINSGWTTSTSVSSPSCGSYYYYYAYAKDAVGNPSSVNYLGSNYGGACCYGCECYGNCYVAPPPPPPPVCDAACQIVQTSNWWQSECPGCSSAQFDAAVGNSLAGIGVTSYADIEAARAQGGYGFNSGGSCTYGLTC